MAYLFLGGLAVVGSAFYMARKMLSYLTDPREADVRAETSSNPTARSGVLNETLRGNNESEVEQALRLEKQLHELNTTLATLKSQYKQKYGVEPADCGANKYKTVKSFNSNKHARKSSKKLCLTSESSSEGSSKASTVILKKPKASSAGSSTTFADAENSPLSYRFSEEEKSVYKDPLVGKAEVEPKEKVEKWLETNTANNLPHSSSGKYSKPKFPKALTMTIPANDPPKMWHSVDKDPFNSCETYIVSSPRRESPKKGAPHLYKRLNLRKKSTVNVDESKKSKSKPRKAEEDTENTPSSNKEKSNVNKKSFSSEPDLRKKKDSGKNETHELQENHNNDEEQNIDYKNHKSMHSDSEHFSDSNNESSDECAENSAHNRNTAGKSNYRSRSVSPSKKSLPKQTGEVMLGETSSKRSGSKLKQSQTQLKSKIDEVLEMKAFEKRKSSTILNKKSEPSISLGETKDRFGSGSGSDEELMLTKMAKSPAKKKGFSNAVRETCSNRERLNPIAFDSCREKENAGKSKLTDTKIAFEAKNNMKLSVSNQERPTKKGTEQLGRRTNSFDIRKDTEDEFHEKGSGSKERPKTADNIALMSARKMNEKSKEFIAKFQLRDVSGKERPKSAEKANSFDKRKEFEAKFHIKELPGSDDSKPVEKVPKTNQFEKRKEFESKFHIKDCSNEDARGPSEESGLPTKVSPFDKRKEFNAKYHMKSLSPDQPPKPAQTVILSVRSGSERRKEVLAQYQKKPLLERSKTPINGAKSLQIKPENKIKEPAKCVTSKIQPSPGNVAIGKAEKLSPLQRRMSYDAKHRMKPLSQSKRNPANNHDLQVENTLLGVNGADSNADRLLNTEKSLTPATQDESNLFNLPKTSPTMNRQPNDGTRKTYLFDWESKRYAVADKQDIVTGISQDRKPGNRRGSSIPPRKAKPLAPQDIKRPLSAGGKMNEAKSTDSNYRGKLASEKKKKFGTDSDDENSSENDRFLVGKSSSEWGSQPSANSFDFGFDAKGLNDSNFSSAVSSDVSEETMVKELKNKVSARRCPEDDSDEENDDGNVNATTGEVRFSRRSSDCEQNEIDDRSRLNNLDLASSVSGISLNSNRLNRSAARMILDDEDDPSSHVFTGTRALRKSKKSLFTKGSCDELSVLTKGFKRVAKDET